MKWLTFTLVAFRAVGTVYWLVAKDPTVETRISSLVLSVAWFASLYWVWTR